MEASVSQSLTVQCTDSSRYVAIPEMQKKSQSLQHDRPFSGGERWPTAKSLIFLCKQ